MAFNITFARCFNDFKIEFQLSRRKFMILFFLIIYSPLTSHISALNHKDIHPSRIINSFLYHIKSEWISHFKSLLMREQMLKHDKGGIDPLDGGAVQFEKNIRNAARYLHHSSM